MGWPGFSYIQYIVGCRDSLCCWEMMRFVTALMLAAGVRADTADPVDIVQQSIAAVKENRAKARSYAYQEYNVQRHFDAAGKETGRESYTWDVMALEGSTYRKLILKNDKPLPAKDQKKEDERLRKEAARRKNETPDERRRRLFHVTYSYSIPYPRIPEIYDLKLLREDAIESRPVYVIECTPKPSFTPTTPEEKESVNFRTVLWIDKQELQPIRYDLEVIGETSRLKKGSTATLLLSKINNDAWMSTETNINYQMSMYKMIKARGQATTTYSNFKKFQVDSELIVP
jgi:hypothetical protein